MAYLGDFKLGSTIYGYFTTTAADTGAPTQLAGTPAVSVYEDDSNTQITSGVTLGVDADSVTGLNRLTIAATSGNGYEVGKQYTAVITTGTVGGTSAVGYVVAAFSVEKTGLNVSNITYSDGAVAALGIIDSGTAQSATATTLVLRAASGFANDVVNGATIMAFGSTQGYWQSRQVTDYDLATDTVTVDTWTVTPSGTITYILFGTPPAVASGTLPAVNATQIGGQTASASGTVTFPAATLASTTNITAGTITTATNVTTVNGLAANVITAASIATGAIDADAIADGAIDAGAIAANAITDAKIATGAITAAKFAAGAIDAAAIATGAIDADAIAAAALPASKFDAANPVPANVEQINGVTIVGDGSGTPFNV